MKNFKTLFVGFLLVLLLGSSVLSAGIDDIKFVTEQYPPYSYEENSNVKGIAIDMLYYIFKEMKAEKSVKDIELLPWDKVYKMAQEDKNVCLILMTRTPEREPLFKWAGPISETTIGLTGKKGMKFDIEKPEDLKNYKIAVIKDDIGQTLLEDMGVKHFQVFDTNEEIAEKIKEGKIDLWSMETNVAAFELKKADPDTEYENVYTLKDGKLYMVFSKDVSNELVSEFQKALDKVKDMPDFKESLKKYK